MPGPACGNWWIRFDRPRGTRRRATPPGRQSYDGTRAYCVMSVWFDPVAVCNMHPHRLKASATISDIGRDNRLSGSSVSVAAMPSHSAGTAELRNDTLTRELRRGMPGPRRPLTSQRSGAPDPSGRAPRSPSYRRVRRFSSARLPRARRMTEAGSGISVKLAMARAERL